MKKLLLNLSLTFLLALVFVSVDAQPGKGTSSHRTPKWVSEFGYWNIVSNIHSPKLSTVYFYNNNHELLYMEKVEGLVININKRRVKMNLKKVLDQSILAFNEKQKSAENEMLVTNLIRRKQ
ncbi:MAG TPA: hypothetical protein VLR49_12545 [Ferruginibacter sp.]|nr:hypothetical protein [Ferruginibacter sp.]